MSSRTSFLHQSPIRIPSHVPKPLWKSNSMQAFALVQLWYVMSVLSPSTLGIKPKYPRASDIYVIQCGRNNMVAISWINTIFAPRSGDFALNTLVQLWTWDWQPLHCIYWCGQVFKHTHVCIPMGLFTQPLCMGCTHSDVSLKYLKVHLYLTWAKHCRKTSAWWWQVWRAAYILDLQHGRTV